MSVLSQVFTKKLYCLCYEKTEGKEEEREREKKKRRDEGRERRRKQKDYACTCLFITNYNKYKPLMVGNKFNRKDKKI